ncbi:MAG TPA: shikimate kinase, partial [Tepidisphaeraceae bacterium]
MGVVLLGYRGSGKTTLGRRLAERLGWSFSDTDQLVVERTGQLIRQIFEAEGETAFRNYESQALEVALARENAVIATGGGIVLRAENRAALMAKAHTRLYLRCDPAVLSARIHNDPATHANRPALTALGGTIEEIINLVEVREPLYRFVATAEIDVTDLTPDQVLALTLELLEA